MKIKLIICEHLVPYFYASTAYPTWHFHNANNNFIHMLSEKACASDGYNDVGDGCWRANVLVTSFRC